MIKFNKRNNILPENLPFEGVIFTVVGVRESESGMYAYDLVLRNKNTGDENIVGLQKQSFNVDSLITIFGTDNPEEWKLKDVKVVPGEWNKQKVVRFERAEPLKSSKPGR